MIESVVLPAHARSSLSIAGSQTGCGAQAGCYNAGSSSFLWLGGAGPHVVPINSIADCGGGLGLMREIVVAASATEAQAILGCSVIPLSTTLAPLSGCNFYLCGAP